MVFQAHQDVKVMDTARKIQELNDWQYNTPKPPILSGMEKQTDEVRHMGVVPYDMQIGARIMYGLSEKNTEKPPPTQKFVDEAFVAQCPMIMFSDQLSIRAPRCGSQDG